MAREGLIWRDVRHGEADELRGETGNELREHGAEGERRGEARSVSAAPRVSSASAAPKVAAKATRRLTAQVMTTSAEKSRKMAAEAAR